MNSLIDNKLKVLEATSKQYWNIPRETAVHLSLLIKACKYQNILEVGTSNGYSAIWLAEAAKQTNGNVTTIEFFEERINLAQNNLKDCQLDQYVKIKHGKALDIIEVLTKQINNAELRLFDFIFIDANKAESIDYFNALDPLLLKGGMFVADNVTSHESEMKDFLYLFNNHPGYQVSYLPFGGGTLIGLKRNFLLYN